MFKKEQKQIICKKTKKCRKKEYVAFLYVYIYNSNLKSSITFGKKIK